MTPVLKSLNPYRQKLNIVLGIFAFTLIVSVFLGYIFSKEQSYSEQVINEVYFDVEPELQNFLSSIEKNLLQVKQDYLSSKYSFSSVEKLNEYFASILNECEGISSIYLGNSKGEQYYLYRDKNSWISGTRIISENKNQLQWCRIDDDKNIVSKWVEVINYDPREEDWFGKLNITFSDSITWTPAHQFFSTKQFGTTALAAWVENTTGDTLYCSANIPLISLKKAVSKLDKYRDRKIYLLIQDKYYVSVPEKGAGVLANFDALNNDPNLLLDNDIEIILNEWNKLSKKVDVPFSFSLNENLWWNRIEKIELNSKLKAGISITETALHTAETFFQYFIYIVLFIIIAIQSVFMFIFWKKRNDFQAVLDETQVWKDYAPDEVELLLKKGENNFVEFKSSLRWDYHEDKVNKHLEEVILKSVAAFNNGKGGTLIIGVDDYQNVLGLEKDCQSLKRKDIDYFEIHIRNLFNQTFGINFTTTNLKISFPKYEDKTICIIEIIKGSSPIFVEMTDQKGRKTENFFIRSGNTSQKVESIVEISNYIAKRFAEKSES